MKPSLKKVCIFSLAAGIGKMINSQIHKFDMDDERKKLTLWNANQIAIAGEKALMKCGIKIDNSRLKQSTKKINEAAIQQNDNSFDVLETLSFLFLGLNDITHYSKNKTYIKDVEDAALNFMVMYDPNLEKDDVHIIAAEKYQRWINGE